MLAPLHSAMALFVSHCSIIDPPQAVWTLQREVGSAWGEGIIASEDESRWAKQGAFIRLKHVITQQFLTLEAWDPSPALPRSSLPAAPTR